MSNVEFNFLSKWIKHQSIVWAVKGNVFHAFPYRFLFGSRPPKKDSCNLSECHAINIFNFHVYPHWEWLNQSNFKVNQNLKKQNPFVPLSATFQNIFEIHREKTPISLIDKHKISPNFGSLDYLKNPINIRSEKTHDICLTANCKINNWSTYIKYYFTLSE